jgi:hypothetical protein
MHTIKIGDLTINPVEEALSQNSAKEFKTRIKNIILTKGSQDLEFCKFLFFSKISYVNYGNDKIPLYEFYGYESWKDYIENELLLLYSKAKKYADVYSKFCVELVDLFDPEKHMLDIHKMIALTPIIDSGNFKEYMKLAKKVSSEAFKSFLKPHKKAIKKSFVKIQISEERIFKKAIKQARKDFGQNLNDNQLLVAILSEYLEGKNKDVFAA